MDKIESQPLGQKVLILPNAVVDKIGSIYIPEGAKEKPLVGQILKIGLGRKNADGTHQPFDVEVGQRVLFSKFGGTEIEIQGQKLKLVDESDVLMILKS